MAHVLRGLVALAVVAAACSGAEPVPTTASSAVPSPATSAPAASAAPTTTMPPLPTATPATTVAPRTTTTAATTTTTTAVPSIDDVSLALELVADGFRQPVFLTAPEGDGRLFIVDQVGIVWVIDDADPTPFLDIRREVAFGGEQGLLGLAFDPGYAANGVFYVNYTGRDGATNVVSFSVSAEPDRADPASGVEILRVAQPASNHNGGMLAFGPEGNLWIGMGDGGASNDRFGNGQRADTLLGAMLRIRVGPGIDGYEIPQDNPYRDGGGAPEVWSIGLRNPWRFAFGPAVGFGTPVVYVADVGQNRVEEVTVAGSQTPGLNYGWPITEGDECFQADSCDDRLLVPPIVTYGHDEGCSITGGFVYEGDDIPALAGHYLYGDYCSGFVRSVVRFPLLNDRIGSSQHDLFPEGTVPNLTSFGRDGHGELYLLSRNGSVFKLVAP